MLQAFRIPLHLVVSLSLSLSPRHRILDIISLANTMCTCYDEWAVSLYSTIHFMSPRTSEMVANTLATGSGGGVLVRWGGRSCCTSDFSK